MPEAMSSWADEIEEGDLTSLPQPSEKWIGNNKITTEFIQDENGQKFKVVRTFKMEKKLVSKAVARRKALHKFGKSQNDRPGPDPATTVVSEEIVMNFIANKEESEKEVGEESAIDIIRKSNKGIVKCRICKEDHWTSNCPYKDTLGPLRESLAGGEKEEEGNDKSGPGGVAGGAPNSSAGGAGGPGAGGKYVPPSKRGDNRMGESMPDRKRTEDTAAIRVSNLSENTQEGDLQDLFKPFGSIARIFLAKDKVTNQCKGFAFINYHKKDDAARAIAYLNGHGYDHLILTVEWAKPHTN